MTQLMQAMLELLQKNAAPAVVLQPQPPAPVFRPEELLRTFAGEPREDPEVFIADIALAQSTSHLSVDRTTETVTVVAHGTRWHPLHQRGLRRLWRFAPPLVLRPPWCFAPLVLCPPGAPPRRSTSSRNSISISITSCVLSLSARVISLALAS
jgi:hypothetical protein